MGCPVIPQTSIRLRRSSGSAHLLQLHYESGSSGAVVKTEAWDVKKVLRSPAEEKGDLPIPGCQTKLIKAMAAFGLGVLTNLLSVRACGHHPGDSSSR